MCVAAAAAAVHSYAVKNVISSDAPFASELRQFGLSACRIDALNYSLTRCLICLSETKAVSNSVASLVCINICGA